MPTDQEIEGLIDALESERQRLRGREEGEQDQALAADRDRLEEIRVELDRLWDLQRQRRALRAAGRDPDEASERAAGTVENYWQ